MKKEIPQPLVIGSIALVVLVAGFLLWKAIQGPGELPRAPITIGSEPIPSYMKDQMTPEMQKMIEEQTQKYGAQQGGATSESSQPAPTR